VARDTNLSSRQGDDHATVIAMITPVVYPPYPDLHMTEMIKVFRQALETAEVEARIDGMSKVQVLEMLHRALVALHGSSVNRGYTRSVFYSCTDGLPPEAPPKWSQVLVGCLELLSALNESQPPRFWSAAATR
jgi:hypothetical protein